MSNPTRFRRKILLLGPIFLLATALLLTAWHLWQKVTAPNVTLGGKEKASLCIPTGSAFPEVMQQLTDSGWLVRPAWFEWTARKMEYPKGVKPGRYILHEGMSSRELASLLRSGQQTPVKVAFHNIYATTQLAKVIASQIEADSLSLITLMNDSLFLHPMGFSPVTVPALFIPNTYEFYWNSTAQTFLERMHTEYKRFWNPERTERCKKLDMTPIEVSILASVIEQETQKNSEKKRMAGVYLNRLRKKIPLQADPTVKFALGDRSLRRILFDHLKVKSPYNTYLHTGLPPGPICTPSIASIDAVLWAEEHDFLYFCAADDFSGLHLFARTLREHSRNAQKYRAALNKAAIK